MQSASLIENFKIAYHALRANKLRSALTMLGIIIGVSAVITLLSVGRGVEKYIADAFGSIGTNLLFVLPGSPTETSSGPPREIVQGNVVLGPALTERDADALRDQQGAIVSDERTRLYKRGDRLWHTDTSFMAHKSGWSSSLDCLAEFLAESAHR